MINKCFKQTHQYNIIDSGHGFKQNLSIKLYIKMLSEASSRIESGGHSTP